MDPKEILIEEGEKRAENRQALYAKAREAKSPEELLALANENGYELNEEAAKEYFDQLHQERELADEELENVAGGWLGCDTSKRADGYCHEWRCQHCGSTNTVDYPNGTTIFYCRTCGPSVRARCDECKFSYWKKGWMCSKGKV